MINNRLPKQRLTLSREAEQSVIGGLMLENSRWKEIKTILSVEDFVLPEHRLLFLGFEELDTQSKPFDPVTFSYHLEQEGTLATIGGNHYLRLLMDHTPSTANIIAYAKIVKECALNRQLIEQEGAARRAFDIGDDVFHEALSKKVSELKTTINQFKNNTHEKSIIERMKQSFTEVTAMKFEPVQWVVQDILPTGVSMLLAKPKQGKSWFALDLAMAVATGSPALGCKSTLKGDVLYFAFEDNQRRMSTRINQLARHRFGRVPDNANLITGSQGIPRLSQGFEDELDLYLRNQPNTRLVVVDPFTFIETPPKRKQAMRSYQEDYDAIVRLTNLTREKHPQVAILLVYHMRKAGSGNWLDTVMGTTGLAGAVDNLLFMRRENAQSDAVFYLTGKDIENESEYAMSFDKNTACWQLLGNAQEYALTPERREIIDCIRKGITHYTNIAKTLGKTSETIRKTLSKMKSAGQVISLSKGEYEVVYPIIGGNDSHNSNKVTSAMEKLNFNLKN